MLQLVFVVLETILSAVLKFFLFMPTRQKQIGGHTVNEFGYILVQCIANAHAPICLGNELLTHQRKLLSTLIYTSTTIPSDKYTRFRMFFWEVQTETKGDACPFS